MKKIAIVTPELAGLYKNGGIGTNYFFRARFLARHLRYQVTLFFTGTCTDSAAQTWRKQFGEDGIHLEIMPDLPQGADWNSIHRRSMAVHQGLAIGTWDEIHFAEYQANGFVCVQAKRAGLAYSKTRLVVTMHSSSRWCREAGWSLDPETDVRLDYAERYCCENADTLISPSRYLMNWAERKGWRFPAERLVLPSLHEPPGLAESAPNRFDPRHLIFFGRLETRKGIEIFCDAIERLAAAGKAPVRVDFLGKVGSHDGKPADQYVRSRSSRWPGTETRLLTDFDSAAAIKHIRAAGGLAIIASPRDNLPYSAIECIVHGVPFIAANAGGIPELADPRVLFAPTAAALAAKIGKISGSFANIKFDHPYKIATAQAAWEQFYKTPWESAEAFAPSLKVSVCVSCHRHSGHLSEALASLARQTMKNFEVLVMHDDAADAEFDRLQNQYDSFRFFRQPNSSVAAAHNFAATQAAGDILVFMDADTVAAENMLEVFAHAMQTAKADCVTSHYDMLPDNVADLPPTPASRCVPLGPCLEAGWRSNVFAGPIFAVRKKTFETAGGFAESSVSDWQLLARLALDGFHQIVIPQSLYWHRCRHESSKSEGQTTRAVAAILEMYRSHVSSWPGGILEYQAFGPLLAELAGHPTNHRLPKPETNSRRGKFLTKLQSSCVKRLLKLAEIVGRV